MYIRWLLHALILVQASAESEKKKTTKNTTQYT